MRYKESYCLFFAKRKPKSDWSNPNRERVARMIAEGQMTSAGQAVIDSAKKTGSWTALEKAGKFGSSGRSGRTFSAKPTGRRDFEAFPRFEKRGILE